MLENNTKVITTRQLIQNFKHLYDEAGVQGCGELINLILRKKFEDEAKILLFNILMKALYKFDTCTSNCFDDLDRKKMFSCLCNGETVSFPLEMDDSVGAA
jgi:hypothetical protein